MLLWDPRAEAVLAEIGRHDQPVRALVALADGRVISGGSDGVRLWDVSRQMEIARIGSPVEAMAVLPQPSTKSWLVLAHKDHGISEWIV